MSGFGNIVAGAGHYPENNNHMKRIIRKVAVLGSGVMGSRIACHFAGAGIQVLLLDIAPTSLTDAEKSKNLTLDHPAVKNRIVNDALAAAIKSNPSPGRLAPAHRVGARRPVPLLRPPRGAAPRTGR